MDIPHSTSLHQVWVRGEGSQVSPGNFVHVPRLLAAGLCRSPLGPLIPLQCFTSFCPCRLCPASLSASWDSPHACLSRSQWVRKSRGGGSAPWAGRARFSAWEAGHLGMPIPAASPGRCWGG